MAKSSTQVVKLALQANDVKNSVKSFQFSKKYVKRIIQISVLNILYRRIDIPESEFVPKEYEKVPYMIFKAKSKNRFIRTYHSIGMGIMDALEKDYLREISIYILRKGTRDPLETYNIKVKYNKEDTKSDQRPNEVKAATSELLRAFTELPGKKWQEENVDLFILLSYNEDTPNEYEPPNFEAAKENLPSGATKFVSLGKINTGFHKLSSWGRGKNFSESGTSTPAPSILLVDEDAQDIISEEEPVKSSPKIPNKAKEQEAQPSNKRKLDKISLDNTAAGEREDQSKKPKGNKSILSNTGETNLETVSVVSSVEYVECLCKWNLPEEYETATCTKCYATVHLACHGFMTPKAVDKDTFMCLTCSGGKYDKDDLNRVMKLRVILYGIFIHNSIPSELQFASKEERNYILVQLENFGVRSMTSTSIRDINQKGLNNAIQLLFQNENSQFLE